MIKFDDDNGLHWEVLHLKCTNRNERLTDKETTAVCSSPKEMK